MGIPDSRTEKAINWECEEVANEREEERWVSMFCAVSMSHLFEYFTTSP